MVRITDSAAAAQKLEEIRQEVLEICQPRYHEFHRDVHQHGYSKITIARTRP